MARARAEGGITWAELWGQDQGILLWDSLRAASVWAEREWGSPWVVAEIPWSQLDPAWIQPWRMDLPGHEQPYRTWLYLQEIQFDRVWWHRFQNQELEDQAPGRDQPLPQGWIGLDVTP